MSSFRLPVLLMQSLLLVLLATSAWAATSASSSTSSSSSTSLSSSSSSSASHGACDSQATHQWYTERYQYLHLENWILTVLVLIASAFELFWHHIHHKVTEIHGHGEVSGECTNKYSMFKTHQKPLATTLVDRCSGELMVLGFLTLIVWSCARSGTFANIACFLENVAHITLPSEAHGYLESIEDVHMHLFLCMVMFISINAVAVKRVNAVQDTWMFWSKKLTGATEEMGQIKSVSDAMDKLPPGRCRLFGGSRILLLKRLQTAAVKGELHEDLMEVLDDLSTHMTGKDLDPHKMSTFMNTWFSFDRFLSLQCHMLMVDLVEIKLFTWLYLVVGFITAALLLGATHSLFWHWVVIAVQLLVAACFGLLVPMLFKQQQSDSKMWQIDSFHETMNELDSWVDKVASIHPKLKVQDFPMLTAQLMTFFWCYNVVRLVCSSWWWSNDPVLPIIALVMGVISVPTSGLLMGEIVSRMGIWMGRGDTGIHKYHQAWLEVMASRELSRRTSDHHRKVRAQARSDRAVEMIASQSKGSEMGVEHSDV